MQQMQQQQKSESQFYHFDNLPAQAPESSTLEIGQECINFCGGDAQKAIEKFEIHKIEIILTNLHNLLALQKSQNDEVFKQVVQFIEIEDGA